MLKILHTWAACLVLSVPQVWARAQFSFDDKNNVWTLANDKAEVVFALDSDGQFVFRTFRDLSNGDKWEAWENSTPFSLRVGSTLVGPKTAFSLVDQRVEQIERGGTRQVIILRDMLGIGLVQFEAEMYDGSPVLRYCTRIHPLSASTTRIRGMDMLPWTFAAGSHTFRALRLNQWVYYGEKGNFEPLASILSPGTSGVRIQAGAHAQHCGWVAVRDEQNRGLFAGWEFNGRVTVTVRHIAREGGLQIYSSLSEIDEPVAPGDDFVTPHAFIGLFHGEWDDASNTSHRFVEQAVAVPVPDGDFPYVIWNSWGYQYNIDESTLRREAELAARLGIEVFVVDLGWARRIGEWFGDEKKFPSGLRQLSDYVHSLGMKFGLHLPFAEADPESPVLRDHPDWRSSESYGYFGADSLCLSNRATREWVISEIVRVIDDYAVDWLVQDGENMVKRCTKTSHTHLALGSNYSNAVNGLDAVIRGVRERRPNVLWENCEDGGNMMTFRVPGNYVTSISSDNSDPLTTRQAIYGLTYLFPPRYTDRYMGDEELNTYNTRSSMFGGPWIFMNRLTRMRPQDLEFAAKEIGIYKKMRTRVRDGQVYHLTSRPTEKTIDALQSYHPASDTAVVFVTRPEATQSQWTLRPRGLRKEGKYRVRFEEDSRVVEVTGESLMTRGVTVRLPSMWMTEIVHIEPAN